MPYRVVFDNAMETLLIGEAVLIYLAELITLMWTDSQSQKLFAIILAVNLVFRAGVYVFIAAQLFRWVRHRANRVYAWLARAHSSVSERRSTNSNSSLLQPLLDHEPPKDPDVTGPLSLEVATTE